MRSFVTVVQVFQQVFRRPGLVRFLLPLCLSLAAVCAHAQLDNGSVTGTVHDASGAVIAGASVTIRNVATGVATALKTNQDGTYQALGLIPGTYEVEVTAPGFGITKQTGIEVHVKTRAQVDFDLKPGGQNDTVEVKAEVLGLQTQSADVGNVISTTQINDLPLNARRYADLALLEPGIFKNPAVANNAPDRFSSNGNLETQNYFALDGVDNNSGSTNLQEGSVQNVQPPPDAIQEFRLQTRTYSTEFGTSAGAVVNASTKSGTNSLHGSAWEYARNSVFDANSWLNNRSGIRKGNFSQNQFGATIGGPIVKDRLFFFGDYQGLRSTQQTTVNSVVPSAAMKNGDMSEIKGTSLGALYNPRTTLASQTGCIVTNSYVVNQNCIDPVARRVLALLPNPNNGTGPFSGNPNYVFAYQLPQQVNSFDTRIDQKVTERHSIFGRYSFLQQHRQDPPWTANGVVGNGGFATDYKIRNQGLALGWTTIFSSTAVNQARFGWSRDNAHSDPIGLTLGTSAAPDVGLSGVPVSPYSAGLPPLNIAGGFRRIGVDLFRPQFQAAQVYQFLDTFTKLKGKHSLMFGYEYHRNTLTFLDLQAPQGYMNFSGLYTGTNGFGFADFLLGNVNQTIFNSALVVHNFLHGNSFFAQDTWRVAHNLTLNFGTRYELYSPMLNRTNSLANFNPANGGSLTVASSGGWAQRALINPDKNNFAPRIGFSYQASDKIVLRGGYGVFYQYINRVGSEAQLAQNQPFLKFVNDNRTTGNTPVFFLKDGFPGTTYANATTPLYIQKSNWQDPDQRTSYVQQMSFGPQIQLPSNMVLETIWVGNFGHKMNRLRNSNQGQITGFTGSTPNVVFPYANLNSGSLHAFLEKATNDGNTNYNGLVTSLRRPMKNGLAYQFSYTWAHAFSDYADNLTAGSTPQNAYDYAHEYSQSPFDQRHRFVANAQWKLPIGRDGLVLNSGSTASKLLGGWQLNAIVTMESGNPFNVTATDLTQTGGSHATYANCNADGTIGSSRDRSQITNTAAAGRYLNPAAFSQPGTGTFGTCRPRPYAGPGRHNEDLSLFKQFEFTDVKKLELRFEFFNALNHPNLAAPAASIASPGTFGKITSVVNNARQVQMAAKFYF